MPWEAWVVIVGVILAGAAGTFWTARQYDQMADGYQKQLEAADQVHQRSLALLDRQEELLRRAELLVGRLEKQRDSG